MRDLKSKILRIVNSKLFSVISVVLMTVILFTQADHKYGYTSNKVKTETCIISDGTAYYAYLPQYIVYNDQPGYQFMNGIDQKNQGVGYFSMLKIDSENNKVTNKFYVGTALLQSPFYFIAHKLHQWNSWNADGYQLGYRASIQIAALFYWLLGVYALFQLFARFQFSRFSVLMGIVIITFGTNLNDYVSYIPSMSHAYSFSMVACFLNVSHLWGKNEKRNYFLLALFILGLITVIRPVNFLVILIVPFFFESFTSFIQRLKTLIIKNYLLLLIGVMLFALPILLNILSTYDQFGEFGLYTYKDEGFSNAFHPEIFNVLFSFKKGFFVYAPVMLILIIAMYFFVKKTSKYFIIGWSICVIIWLYAISSWWCWDYGGGLGMRAMIEFLPLLLFPILYLFKFGGKLLLGVVSIFCIVSIYFYQLFQFQYNHSIIHCCEMDQEQFWNVFMKTDERHRWMVDFDLLREKLPDSNLKEEMRIVKSNNEWQISNLLNSKTWISFDEENNTILNLDSTDRDFKAIVGGRIKLNDSKINPFVSVKYFSNDVFIEEFIFTIGSRIENPFVFEQFEIEINHSLVEKELDKVLISFHHGGGSPEYKNLVISKFK